MLRLITTAMYDNALTVYREYVQNSVDAIDAAIAKEFSKSKAEIHIGIDHAERCITIRDNGTGVAAKTFARHMKAIGWSEKKGTTLRGIWGIGRLAGLAYCKHLVFRTKARGENTISQIDWDGQRFRELLSAPDQNMDLSEIVEQISTISSEKTNARDPGFFEVQINQVVRHGNDVLLNDEAVKDYLAQVAPVPFRDDAPFGEEIKAFLMPHVDVSGYCIYLNEADEPIYKPHQKKFAYAKNRYDKFSEFDRVEIKGASGKLSAVGWVLHHSYFGALKNSPLIRGIRVRSGNMQIGNERILSGIFPEERFNNWSVGEFHILDPMLRPNGQRSNLEDTPVFRDIKNKLTPRVGRQIAKKCRDNSAARNKAHRRMEQLKDFEESLSILRVNILSPKKVAEISAYIEQEATASYTDGHAFPRAQRDEVRAAAKKVLKKLDSVKKNGGKSANLGHLPKTRLGWLHDIADLVYQHAPNTKARTELLSRIREHAESKKR